MPNDPASKTTTWNPRREMARCIRATRRMARRVGAVYRLDRAAMRAALARMVARHGR